VISTFPSLYIGLEMTNSIFSWDVVWTCVTSGQSLIPVITPSLKSSAETNTPLSITAIFYNMSSSL